ncbi:TonB-dependent receptor plug domain-containing protein [Pseudoalteromonas denitrificans]|uniref:Outer membrane cobalamin receptor protein n=1 Tax=Pseudoalteromonas denitrificans DSM 6059 TaxID=1123010 RepID=A0A1I1FAJ8_9GAMM|nr:TonB-dependent receptor [Pseudoalteromonas denitrificans]SFB96301.1 Outer membrane cobalamin receptor protein [Pseudoalteromonas denitrificans DSM 6059]
MRRFKIAPLTLVMSAVITTPQIQATEEIKNVERIMVTGSRIARTELASTSPITVVNKQAMINMGITDISSALRRLPALTGNTTNNQSSSGANSIQTATLRGIEATNTLVLVNGRRVVGSDADGLVDLSSIPFEAVQEMQVLKDGASAIYGSDAIAGVINIITKKRFDGFDVNTHYGVSSEGDAQERKIGLVTGGSTDKASFMLAASTTNISGWKERDRHMTHDADFGFLGGDNKRSGTAPNARLTGFGLPEYADALDADGNKVPVTWTVLDANNPSNVSLFDYDTMGYNYRDVQSGANDSKTNSIFLTADYQLNDETRFFTELSFHDGFVQGNQAPPGTDTGWYAGSVETPNAFLRYDDAGGNHFGVGPNQKYNPFGIAGNVSRRFSEYGPRIYKTNNKINRYTFGFQGEVAQEFDWEVVFSQQSAELVTSGGSQPSINRIERALSDECETQADPTCVALNVFGPEGSITPDMLDYINITAPVQTNKNDLMFIQASIAGPLLELPAGDLMFAMGTEYREDQLTQEVDISQRTESFDVSWAEASTPVISPVREIKEFYIETKIPLLDNLELEAAVRYSEYSDIDENTTNPKFGILYKPMDALTLRGSFSTGFRAPTMAQMYQGQTVSLTEDLHDPCNPKNEANYFNTSISGCQGLNPAFSKNSVLSSNVIGGGNPDLKPEEADNMTLGVVFEASDNLAFTLDYFEIEQTNVVFASTNYVIDQYVSGNPDYVNDVERSNNGTGYISSTYAPANNIASRNISGIDLNANYLIETSVGEFRFNLDVSRMTAFEVQDTSDSAFRDIVGDYDSAFGSIPETKASLQVDWNMDSIRATYDASYNSEIEGNNVMASTVFHNVQVGYFIEEYKMDVKFGIQNLFDKPPPLFKQWCYGYR